MAESSRKAVDRRSSSAAQPLKARRAVAAARNIQLPALAFAAKVPRSAGQAGAVQYSVLPVDLNAHLFEVTCRIDDPDAAGQQLALPAWNPGSYMIREFARHVRSITARCAGKPVHIEKLDKHTWRADPVSDPLTVIISVYAWDLSVRGAYLDADHGFFNGTCVFLRVLGQEDRPCLVDLRAPGDPSARDWRVATALSVAGARRHGFGRYQAANYDELIDHPVQMGRFALTQFRAHGVPHEVALTGVHEADLKRLAGDLKAICETQIGFFGLPAPMKRYVFLITAVGEGYGGLEHRASTALLCSRNDLPLRNAGLPGEAYRGLLGLASHEYFHTWNVKRIKPAAFIPYHLDRENYTTLLWAFEGFTSYYDDLMLVRSGRISRAEYLENIAHTLSALARTPARRHQSVSESSFDAWIKYYRQDEDAPNAVVSYYGKGSLIALALDLALREETGGRRSLDDLMRALWSDHLRSGEGVTEQSIKQALRALCASPARRGARSRLSGLLQEAIHGTGELPLASLFAAIGVQLVMRVANGPTDRGSYRNQSLTAVAPRIDLGIRIAAEGEARLTHVLAGSAAQRGGLAANDVVLSINRIRVNAKNFDARLQRMRAGAALEVHFFRRDELCVTQVRARVAAADTCDLIVTAPEHRLLAQWLAGERT